MKSLRDSILEIDKDFFKALDSNLRLFASEIRKELRDEGHVVIGVTGYPGKGKSNNVSIISAMIDYEYSLQRNICFIPTSKEIESRYMNLPMYSVLHIDEASRGLHKHKWHDKIQQKLNELYDTEREGHFLCTFLIMPRFQNFAENFRNFMIKYWIDIPHKGVAIFYKRDEDKDTKDPWHIDENYKAKQKYFSRKRVFETTLPDYIRAEQRTKNYWFFVQIPPIPKEVWSKYQELKKQSRIESKEKEVEVESYKDKIARQKHDKWNRISELKSKGMTHAQIAVVMNLSTDTIRKTLKEIQMYNTIVGKDDKEKSEKVEGRHLEDNSIISNQIEERKFVKNEAESNKSLFVTQSDSKIDEALEDEI